MTSNQHTKLLHILPYFNGITIIQEMDIKCGTTSALWIMFCQNNHIQGSHKMGQIFKICTYPTFSLIYCDKCIIKKYANSCEPCLQVHSTITNNL